MEHLAGKKFGVYEIVALLGEGGMASVYKARQPAMDRYVAIKILPQHLAQDPDFVARFEREARILAQLQHPHILPVFDYGNANGYPYLVMPMLAGGTLADTFDKTPQSLQLIRQRMSQIGDALDYAHERGLVHRDVKPSNVLLDERNNCLLSDFGLAKVLESANKITASGGIVGTPYYMSPEQASGNTLDRRTDIYSLGVMLYEMATGRVPFSADTPIAVVLKHIQDPLPSPRAINPDIPYSLELVIIKALEKDPANRFSTAAEMVTALRSAIPEKTLLLPESEIREVLPTIVQQPVPTLVQQQAAPLPVQPQPVLVQEIVTVPLTPAPKAQLASASAPVNTQPRIGGHPLLSDIALMLLPVLGWGLGAYAGILISPPKALEVSFTTLALAGTLGGALLGLGMALKSHPFRWWWALILGVVWMMVSVETFNVWAGLGALLAASVITPLIAKNFEKGLQREHITEMIGGWVLAGFVTCSIYMIFRSYVHEPFQAKHAGMLGVLMGAIGGYYTSVIMRAARKEREEAALSKSQPLQNVSAHFGGTVYRILLTLAIIAVGYRGLRVVLPESTCYLGVDLWSTHNVVEWEGKANEFRRDAGGQRPKIVAVIGNARFLRTSCGTGFGHPLDVVVTLAGSNKVLMNVSCPVYGDYAACTLYDPASNTNTFNFSNGSYELHLMYGDVTTPVKIFPFSVAP
jgi:serine/threonine protein kinase